MNSVAHTGLVDAHAYSVTGAFEVNMSWLIRIKEEFTPRWTFLANV